MSLSVGFQYLDTYIQRMHVHRCVPSINQIFPFGFRKLLESWRPMSLLRGKQKRLKLKRKEGMPSAGQACAQGLWLHGLFCPLWLVQPLSPQLVSNLRRPLLMTRSQNGM